MHIYITESMFYLYGLEKLANLRLVFVAGILLTFFALSFFCSRFIVLFKITHKPDETVFISSATAKWVNEFSEG